MAVPGDGDCERDERLILQYGIVAFYGEGKVNGFSIGARSKSRAIRGGLFDLMLGGLASCTS
jgi:hypothetical protein